MLCYCDKCGSLDDWAEPEKHKCYCCDNFPLIPIPREYIDNFRWRDGDGKECFKKEVIETSPNLDKDLYIHKDEILKAKNDEMKAKMAIGRAVLNGANPKEALKGNFAVVKCPSCNSTNVSKIGTINRAMSIGLFGLASSKIGKTHKCNNCGTMW